MNRRHLSREQKRELIAESLKADPELSNREHARRTGAHHQLVGNIREELVRGGQVDESSTSRGADGKVYPASQPPRPEPEPESESGGEDDTPAPSWEPAGHLHPATSPVETTKRPNLDPTTRTSRKAAYGDSRH